MRGLLAIFALSGVLFGQVVINEIMFKPDPSNHEWIEIYNAGTDPVDINGWYITDPGYSGRIVDSSFVIEPGEFVILTEYDTTFSCRTIYVDHWPYLNNDGDTIFLRDADSSIVDAAVYSVSGSWEHNISIELIDYSADNSDPANWQVCTDPAGATPCEENSASAPPTSAPDLSVSWIDIYPENPRPDEPCTISVKIRNIGDETAAGFNFFGGYIQGSETTIVATEPLPEIAAGDSVWVEFELTLPAGTYTIYAAVDDTVGTNNHRTYEITITEPGEAPRIIITEIMFKPTVVSEEWIEIYNDDDSPVDLANWTIADATGSATLTTESFVVNPGEYAILSQSDIADRFSCAVLVAEGWRYLNNDGDSIRLYDSFGNLVDSAFYSASDSWENDVSAERDSLYADGGNPDNWSACTDPAGSTPCADNSVWPTDYDLAIVGMSVSPFRPEPDQPCTVAVEIQNEGTNTASGYTVSLYYDSDRSHTYTEGDSLLGTQNIPTLEPGGVTAVNFVISLPQGMHSLVALLSDTVRANNEFNLTVQVGASIVITEIMFKPTADDHEWIEIYNAGTEPVDLANWQLADPNYTGTITEESFVVEPGSYAIISQVPIGGFECPAIVAEGWPYLNNDGDELSILNADGEVVDRAVYDVEGEWADDVSAERLSINADGADPNNWKPSRAVAGSTPCEDNSIWSAGEEVTCTITPNPFDPTMGEEAAISVNAPVDATIEIRIYDLRGRLIQDFGNRAAVIWDGKDSDGDFAPAGPYVVVAQVEQNGKVSHHRFAIAVAYGMKK